MKANRFITHTRRLKDCAEPLERMLEPTRKLGDHLGPILYQLPPRFRIDLDRLENFLKLLPRDLTHVFEFRDKSWLTRETLALLDGYRASFCVHDMPGSATERWTAGPVAYVRFHGTKGKYNGSYSDAALQSSADWLGDLARNGRNAWVYFNNDYDANAIHNAQTLRAMVGQAVR